MSSTVAAAGLRRVLGLAAVLATVAAPAGGAAQTRPATDAVARVDGRGWIGVNFETLLEVGPEGTSSTVVIRGVHGGGPGDRGGLHVGDVVVGVAGRPANLSVMREELGTLRPGDAVSLRIRRGGRERVVALRAAPRPEVRATAVSPAFLVRIDSATVRLLSDAESALSAQGTIVPGGWLTATRAPGPVASPTPLVSGRVLLRPAEGQVVRFRAPGLPEAAVLVALDGEPAPDGSARGASFGAYATDATRTSELLRRIRTLEGELRALRTAEAQEARRLASALEANRSIARVDAELRARREERVRAERELGALLQRAGQVGPWTSVGTARSSGWAGAAEAAPHAGEATSWSFVSVDPHALGRSYVAGARFRTLSPGLARYFRAERGLLVVDLAEGTPAGDAGLRPGDVVVQVAGREARTVEELRAALAASRDTAVPLTVVRRDRRMVLRLPLPHSR